MYSKNTLLPREGELRGKSRPAGNFSALILPTVRIIYSIPLRNIYTPRGVYIYTHISSFRTCVFVARKKKEERKKWKGIDTRIFRLFSIFNEKFLSLYLCQNLILSDIWMYLQLGKFCDITYGKYRKGINNEFILKRVNTINILRGWRGRGIEFFDIRARRNGRLR